MEIFFIIISTEPRNFLEKSIYLLYEWMNGKMGIRPGFCIIYI